MRGHTRDEEGKWCCVCSAVQLGKVRVRSGLRSKRTVVKFSEGKVVEPSECALPSLAAGNQRERRVHRCDVDVDLGHDVRRQVAFLSFSSFRRVGAAGGGPPPKQQSVGGVVGGGGLVWCLFGGMSN